MPSFKKSILTALGLLGSAFATNYTLPATLLDLGNGIVGGLYRPANPGPRAGIAVFIMHAEQDYLNFVGCEELWKRGYTVLCANNNAGKSGEMTDLAFEGMLSNAGQGISYLRNQTYIDQIVTLGHSGGGAMLTAYQNIAENGAKACQGPEKLYPCSNKLANLPATDGFISVDTNYGLSTMTMLSVRQPSHHGREQWPQDQRLAEPLQPRQRLHAKRRKLLHLLPQSLPVRRRLPLEPYHRPRTGPQQGHGIGTRTLRRRRATDHPGRQLRRHEQQVLFRGHALPGTYHRRMAPSA